VISSKEGRPLSDEFFFFLEVDRCRQVCCVCAKVITDPVVMLGHSAENIHDQLIFATLSGDS
jgi:hypothetical protein